VIAYKLLRAGAVAPFSGREWPPLGVWLETEAIDSCRTGIHACRARQLPPWLGLGELWEVELGGEISEQERKLVAERGRLVRRVEEWSEDTAREFQAGCVAEVRRRAERSPELSFYADDAAATPAAAAAAYMSARAAELQDGPDGYDAERARQGEWLTATLGLKQ
jgi:hypothetical protein